ncbi:M14 family metallopeptidase [Lentibacillus jeotgali]|uniref:M14 family metallopeptidase n=1 Tax=Lentibacillus jeotgali TaxID=558169 RepID=UPI000262687A|nr:M14 family metallocarboxypeptidase [Lentibacillus jeotgali]
MTHVNKAFIPFIIILSFLLTLGPFSVAAESGTKTLDAPEETLTTGFEDRNGDGWTTLEEEAAFLEDLTEMSERVSYTQVGTSVEGRPIRLVRVGSPEPPSDEEIAEGNSILIMGTPHGNEPAGREMTLELMRDLAFTENEEMIEQLQDATVLFVPTPNPDGRAANTRGNAWGVDNNRDHLNLDTPEMQTVAGILDKFQPDITMDAHERPSATGNPDMEMLWPRNLNVDEELRALNKELVQDYMIPDVEEAGFSTGLYGSPGGAGGGDERILRNMLGLRNGIGILTESAGSQEPLERVEMQREAADSVLRFYRERFDDVTEVVNEAPERQAEAGADPSDPFYLDGADNWDPTIVLDPKACGYLINSSQADEVSKHTDLFSLQTEQVSEHGVFVTMNQPMMTVVPFLLDERANYNEVNGLPLDNCSNPGEVEPPLGAPSLANLEILADRFEEDEEFANDGAARAVEVHLAAISRFEEQGRAEKVVKHLENLLDLLQHQKDNELLTEDAYNLIEPQADSYMKDLQYAFYQGFTWDNGDSWDSSDFVDLHTWPSNPDGATYTIQDNTGQVELDNRLQENGSAFGRMTPDMEETENSEMLVRFKADETGNDQRLRLWLQSDTFTTGSSMPVNGLGVELNLNTDELILRGRYDSSSTYFDRMNANMSDEWHWVRLRKQGDELMVRLWQDDQEEPEEWDMVHALSSDEQLENETGKALMSVINFDSDSSNIFNFDEVIVNDLDQ